MYHPDVSSNTEDFYQDIQSAYKVLINPDTRKKYDLSLGIQFSSWEKQIIGQKFTAQFQAEQLYDEILKGNKKQKVTSPESIEQKLQRDFDAQIKTFKYQSLLKSGGFMSGIVGIGVIWLVWSSIQMIYLGYEGTVTHQI